MRSYRRSSDRQPATEWYLLYPDVNKRGSGCLWPTAQCWLISDLECVFVDQFEGLAVLGGGVPGVPLLISVIPLHQDSLQLQSFLASLRTPFFLLIITTNNWRMIQIFYLPLVYILFFRFEATTQFFFYSGSSLILECFVKVNAIYISYLFCNCFYYIFLFLIPFVPFPSFLFFCLQTRKQKCTLYVNL